MGHLSSADGELRRAFIRPLAAWTMDKRYEYEVDHFECFIGNNMMLDSLLYAWIDSLGAFKSGTVQNPVFLFVPQHAYFLMLERPRPHTFISSPLPPKHKRSQQVQFCGTSSSTQSYLRYPFPPPSSMSQAQRYPRQLPPNSNHRDSLSLLLPQNNSPPLFHKHRQAQSSAVEIRHLPVMYSYRYRGTCILFLFIENQSYRYWIPVYCIKHAVRLRTPDYNAFTVLDVPPCGLSISA